MKQPAGIAFVALALLATTPMTAAASSRSSTGGVAHVAPHPTGQTAKVCTGDSVTVTIIDPSTGRRETRCKCAPGATGILTRNAETGAAALRCLRQAGPRR